MNATFAPFVLSLALAAAPSGVAGAWVMSLQADHVVQVGLALEQDGRKVIGTLMLRQHGGDVPLEGEFVERTLTLSTTADASRALKLTATLNNDGTLSGELVTEKNRLSWTAERLKGQDD
jgi:hypothetical protein